MGDYDAALWAAADRHMSVGGGPNGFTTVTVERDVGCPRGELAAYVLEVEMYDGQADAEGEVLSVEGPAHLAAPIGARVALTAEEQRLLTEDWQQDAAEDAYWRRAEARGCP